jgi:hypothetical protein
MLRGYNLPGRQHIRFHNDHGILLSRIKLSDHATAAAAGTLCTIPARTRPAAGWGRCGPCRGACARKRDAASRERTLTVALAPPPAGTFRVIMRNHAPGPTGTMLPDADCVRCRRRRLLDRPAHHEGITTP